MDVLVIGAGASGLMAAASAVNMGAYVTVYERDDCPGRKLLRTGNGRCNLGNRDLRRDFYHSRDNELIDEYFKQFDEDDTIRTFRSFGLIIKEENGYFYPFCEQASAVRDVLVSNVLSYGVNIHYNIDVLSIHKAGPELFEVKYKDMLKGSEMLKSFNRVILACGSYAGINKKDRVPSDRDGYALAYSLGHRVIPVKPSLCALKCKEDYYGQISGVRCDAHVTLLHDGEYVDSEYGQLQITDYGFSGIPVFQLSHHVGAHDDGSYTLKIDLMPGMSEDEYISLMQGRMLQYQGSTVREFMLGTVHTKLGELLIRLAGLNGDDTVDDSTEDGLINVIGLIKCLSADISGTKDFTQAQCCSGGIPLSEVDKNCMSIPTPGLYICGEMLDVDGVCGGYNLQWAWTTGYIAGRAAGSY